MPEMEAIELRWGPHDGHELEIIVEDPPVTGYWKRAVFPDSRQVGHCYRYVRTAFKAKATDRTIFLYAGTYEK